MPQFQTFVEIPVWVIYTRQRYIPRSRHEEGQAAAIGIHDIELADDLKEWILKEYNEQFISEAWEETE